MRFEGTSQNSPLSARRRITIFCIVLATLCILCPAGHATRYYVKPNYLGGDDHNDGLGWSTAKQSVNAALTAANSSAVWVQEGKYTENLEIHQTGMSLYGGFQGTETAPEQRDLAHHVTRLDGGQQGTVVTVVVNSVLLDGFTIEDGTGSLSRSGGIIDSTTYGGGVYCAGGGLTLANCIIGGNSADYGGDVYSGAAGELGNLHGNVTLTNCTVTYGYANHDGGGVGCDQNCGVTITGSTLSSNIAQGQGGGVNCAGGFVSFSGSTVTGNKATSDGGGAHCALHGDINIADSTFANNSSSGGNGGAVSLASTGSVYVTGCTVTGNSALQGGGLDGEGGALRIDGSSITGNTAHSGGGINCVTGSATISNSMFAGNTVTNGGGGGVQCDGSEVDVLRSVFTGNTATVGGGIRCTALGTVSVTDSVFTGNTGASYGGAVSCGNGHSANSVGGTLVISNCTLTNNSANSGGAAYTNFKGVVTVLNCILANNSSGVYNETATNSGSTIHVSASDLFGSALTTGIPDATGTDGNISVDPLFVLNPSPGPDGNWGTSDDVGDLHLTAASPARDKGNDRATYQGETDMDGKQRIQGPHVDMGAYEYPGSLAGYRWWDVAYALRIAGGVEDPTGFDISNLNVEQTGTPTINLLDAVRLARKAAGVDANP